MLNIKKKNNFTAILQKNTRESAGIIPPEFVNVINYKFNDISEMEITVPKKINSGVGKTVIDNRLYKQIKGKGQQIITTIGEEGINQKKERWIIDGKSVLDSEGSKKIKALSFESKLKQVDFSCDILTRQLVFKSNESDVAEGILDLVIQQCPSWSIGEVDENCRTEMDEVSKEVDATLYESFTVGKVIKNSLLFERDVISTPYSNNNVINLTFNYVDFSTYQGESIASTRNLIHKFDNIYTGITHVKVEYGNYGDYSDSFKYTFILNDGISVEYIKEAPYMKDLKITAKRIVFNYQTGEMVKIQAKKIRNFESGTYKVYEFLTNDIAKAYDCLFIFDSYNKVIHCRDRKSYGRNIPIILSKENFIKSIDQTDDYDELANKLYVKSELATIYTQNPTSQDYIYDLSYLIRNEIISPELVNAWERYQVAIKGKGETLITNRMELNTANKKRIKLESQKTALDKDILSLEGFRNLYMQQEDTVNANRYALQVNAKKDEFVVLLKEIQKCKDEILLISNKLAIIEKSLDMKYAEDMNGLIFDEELLEELDEVTITKEITDTTYVSDLGLYNYAVEYLKEANKNRIDFDIDIKGFLEKISLPKNASWDYYLGLGDYVYVDDGEGLLDSEFGNKIRIVGYPYIPKFDSVDKIDLATRDSKYDNLGKLSDLSRSMSRSNHYVDSYADIWNSSKNTNNFINRILSEGLDNNAIAIKSRSMKNKIDITESGAYFMLDEGNNGSYDRQVYIGGSIIGLTKDNFETCEVAITADGVVSETLIGKIILGQRVEIVNDKETFIIGDRKNDIKKGFGVQIKDENGLERVFLGLETDSDGVRRAKLRLMSKDGSEVVLSEDGIINCYQYQIQDNLSNGKPIKIPIKADSGINYYKEVSIGLYLDKFRAYNTGASSGGSIQSSTSSSGGASTSSSGGGGTSSSSGEYSNTISSLNSTEFGKKQQTERDISWSNGFGIDIVDGTTLQMDRFAHRHDYYYYTLPHTHDIPIYLPSHYHLIDNHSHQVYNHQHSLSIDTTHTHNLIYGIYEDIAPSSISVKVNGQTVFQNITSDREVNITAYMLKNTVNMVEILSSTNGRVTAHVFIKEFRRF